MTFRASFEIPSGPGALFFFRHLAALISSVCAIGMGSVLSVIRKRTAHASDRELGKETSYDFLKSPWRV